MNFKGIFMSDEQELKEFFDWLRSQQDDKKLTQAMVDGANELLALTDTSTLKNALIKLHGYQDDTLQGAFTLSDVGANLIKSFESYVGKPYRDAVGVWTIGYGNTYYPNRKKVKPTDQPLSESEATKLKQDIINLDFAPAVNLMFADEIADGFITQSMFDALVSLAYNIGTRGLAGSGVARHIKARNKQKAGDAFLAWNKGRVNGKLTELRGLTRRRQAERELFLA